MKLKGLPYSVTIGEIQDFFRDFKLVSGSIKIGENPIDKLRTGDAIVLFQSPDECQSAMKSLNK